MRLRQTFLRTCSVLKAVAAGDWSVRAVLTVPLPDLAGDIVRPAGLDFSAHAEDPWVDLEHGRLEGIGRRCVGWARKSLHRPGTPYALEWADLEVPGLGLVRVPIGTTYFDRDDLLQRQVHELVVQDALPGVSLEFLPVESRMIAEQSPLEHRPSYEFLKARVLRWTHCTEPVCPGSLTVTKSLTPGQEVIVKAVRDGRLGREPLHPHLLRAFSRYLPEGKAVSVNESERSTVYDPASGTVADSLAVADVDAEAGDEGAPNNGVSALYAHAQVLLDACAQLEEDIEATDSPDLYREGMKLCDQVRALAEKVKASADRHDGKLQSLKRGEPAPDDDRAEEPADIGTDEEGLMKAVRPVYRAVLRAVRGRKRYRLADVVKGIERARNPLAHLDDIKRTDPEGYRRLIEPRLRRLQAYTQE